MAVGRLSGAWIRQVLLEVYPNGVARRALLDHFSVLLVSQRSSRGAKGRLARRLYDRLLSLQRRGLIGQEAGVVRVLAVSRKASALTPQLTPVLERHLFKCLMAEDGQGDGHTAGTLREARWGFISGALEAGWTVGQAAAFLGLQTPQAAQILSQGEVPPARKK